ncbi:MAG: hypothetical protein R2778_06125 [Saprospiraceae bacterium]
MYSRQKADSRWTLRAAGRSGRSGRQGYAQVLPSRTTDGAAVLQNTLQEWLLSPISVCSRTVSTEPCTECACERCENQTPTGVFTSDLKNGRY